MIRSYWLRILFCGIAAAILGYLIGVVTPKQYDAVVQVLVAPYTPNLSGQQTEADQVVNDVLQSAAPRSVATQVEELTSIGVIEEAARRVSTDTGVPYEHVGDVLSPFDLQDKVTVTAAKESDIVTLHVRLPDEKLAQRVAEAMYMAFEDKNLQQSKRAANSAIEFLRAQQPQIEQQLTAIEAKQTQEMASVNSPNIKDQITASITEVKDLETAVESAKADQASQETRVSALRQQMADVPEFIPGQHGTTENPEYTYLRQQLNAAIADRDQIEERYTAESELVKSAQRRIDGITARLAKIPQYYSPGDIKIPNPTLAALRQEYKLASAANAASGVRLKSLQDSLEAKKADLAKLPEIQRSLNALERNRLVLERISELYNSKLKTLQLAGSFRKSETYPVTPAVAIPRPAVPNYGLNVGLGLFLGLAIGFLWSIGSEAKRNPIRSLGQLNRLSLQPCYRVIPELRTPMRGLSQPPAEVFDSLLVNFVRSEKKGYRLGVLGVSKYAGATTTATNLAIAAAQSGYSVLFVEVDPGNNVAAKLSSADAAGVAEKITVYNANPLEAQGNASGISAGIEAAAQGKDLVIFDFAPVRASGDAFLAANQLDEMILLVRANVTKSVDFLQAQQALIESGCPLVSVTLSRVQDQADDVVALEQQPDVRSIAPKA